MRGWRDADRLFFGRRLRAVRAARGTGRSDDETIAAAVIRVETSRPLPISRLDLPPEDLGFAGARLATADNNTTGGFMGQEFTLDEVRCRPTEAVAALEALVGRGVAFVATMADADTTLALADAAGERRADPERARPRRPAARRRLPRQHAASRAEPGDADRRAGAVPDA